MRYGVKYFVKQEKGLIKKHSVAAFRYFFAAIAPPIIRQTHDKIGIDFECLDLIVNVPM